MTQPDDAYLVERPQTDDEPIDDIDLLDPQAALTGADVDEIEQTGFSPPDREPYRLRHSHTFAEESEGLSLDERLAEEESDETAESLSPTSTEAPRAERLVSADETTEDDDSTLLGVETGRAGYAASAEEAAVHRRRF
jgi:hypothetical protein